MLVAIAGMVIYSWAVEVEKQTNTKSPHASKNSLTEEELKLLKEGMEKADVEVGQSKAWNFWGLLFSSHHHIL